MGVYIRTEKQERQPGTHTLAYYPLTTNGNDASGNGNNLTVGSGMSFGTDGAIFPGRSTAFLTAPSSLTVSSGGTFTTSMWLNAQKIVTGGSRVQEIFFDSSLQLADSIFYVRGDTIDFYIGNYWTPNVTCYENTRYNLVYTNNNTALTVYMNGIQVEAGIFGSSVTSTEIRWGQKHGGTNAYLKGNMKDIIVEDVAWTQQEVTDYFNLTKTLYGIS